MKFSADSGALKGCLRDAASVLPARPANPRDGLLTLEAVEGGRLIASARGGQHRMLCRCAASVDDPGRVAVSGATLLAVTATLSGVADVELVDGGLTVSDSLGHAVLPTSAAPDTGQMGGEPRCTFTMGGGLLADLLRVAADAMPEEDSTLPGHLDGVAFDLELSESGPDLALVAYDTRRLALCRTTLVEGTQILTPRDPARPGRFVATWPGSVVKTALPLLKGAGPVTLNFYQGYCALGEELFSYHAPLSAYEKHMSWRQEADRQGGEPRCEVDATELAAAAARAFACLKDSPETGAMALHLMGNSIVIQASGLSGRSEVSCPAKPVGTGDHRARVGGKYLIQHLRSLGKGAVLLAMPDGYTLTAIKKGEGQSALVTLAGMESRS